jgi:hypothetical protein
MHLSDEIISDIERGQAALHGHAIYDDFKRTLLAVVHSLTEPRAP